MRQEASRLVESRLGQILPELGIIAFLYGGEFLEFGRRVAGLSYVSFLAHRPGSALIVQISLTPPRSHVPVTYEPLSLILAIPLCYRILRWYQNRSSDDQMAEDSCAPSLSSANNRSMSRSPRSAVDDMDVQGPNTYLAEDAREDIERQCTLCLESRGSGEGSGGSVAVTECGHVFCWGCLASLDKVSSL